MLIRPKKASWLPGVRKDAGQYFFGPVFLCCVLQASVVQAQDTELETLDSVSTTITYSADYFRQYDPVTVADMLPHIPGISIALDSGGSDNPRGLGGEEQILINSRRVSGRDDSAMDQLNRIAYDQVSHIDIIRGNASDFGISSSGQVINVITDSEAARSIFFDTSITRYQDGNSEPGASIVMNGSAAGLEYRLSLESEPAYESLVSRETSRHGHGDFSPNDRIRVDQQRDQTNRRFNSNLSYRLDPFRNISLNLLYSETDPPQTIERMITDLNVEPPEHTREQEAIGSSRDSWEVGGDYEQRFENGNRWELLMIANQQDHSTLRQRFRFDPSEQRYQDLMLDTDIVEREQIVRSIYSMNLAEAHDLDIGLERADTRLDSALAMAVNPTREPGELTEVDVPNSTSVIREIRYEGFLVHSWEINQRMNLESTLLYETSEISQTGDVRRSRSFDFVRPKVDYRFDISSSMQLRLSAERFVAQMRFADFSATTDARDDEQEIVAGNPDLTQEQSWRYTANVEYRLPDDRGVINARGFFWDMQDVIGRIDISRPDGPIESANGNIGNGKVYGLQLNGSYRLNPDILASGSVLVRASSVTDPFTGESRRIPPNDRGFYTLGLQHNFPGTDVQYGVDYRGAFQGNRPMYDIDKIDDLEQREDLSLYMEKSAVSRFNLTFRAEAGNILDDSMCNRRIRFDGRISDGVIREIERRCTRRGPQYTLSMRGRF